MDVGVHVPLDSRYLHPPTTLQNGLPQNYGGEVMCKRLAWSRPTQDYPLKLFIATYKICGVRSKCVLRVQVDQPKGGIQKQLTEP